MQQSLKEIEESKKQEKNIWEDNNPFGHFDGDASNLQEIPNLSSAPQSQVKGKGLGISTNKDRKRKASGIQSFFAPRTTVGAQPSIRSALVGKDVVHNADLAIARFFFDTCLPINAINFPYFQPMLDAIAAIGSGYRAPSYHVMRNKKFWNNCELVVKIVGPLIRLLRIVDSDEMPSLGYVYDGMYCHAPEPKSGDVANAVHL
ncbi:hypothetical protein SLEP1_g26274 [Rubroshorea leprosula]|uniref:Uncharacterized protein n=1 Tax=Rubroshorea leprosula TaxID=152421 RepID=A0AAV5JVV4_9ROSI|nr:hypothetical protein SLEP1_g26274 [Rubroshorea leprosula]